MHLENVWKWLDAVDQDQLDPLDQWGVSPSRYHPQDIPLGMNTTSPGADGSPSELKPTPPLEILLRNGSVRVTRQISKTNAHNDEKNLYSKSRVSRHPTIATKVLENENPSQSPAPGISTSSEAMDQQAGASTCQLQASRMEGNKGSVDAKKLPTCSERAGLHNLSEVLQPTPVIQVQVTDPVAVNCQGARVVGATRQSGLRRLQSMRKTSRRHTTDAEGTLHRSNALRRPSNVRAESKSGSKD